MAYLDLNNMCMFEGRVTSNIKSSQVNTQNGPMNKVSFGIAIPRNLSTAQRQEVKNGNPNNIPTTVFVNCYASGAEADLVLKYFPAGKAIKAVGVYDTWESTNQNGQKQYFHGFQIVKVGFTSTDAQNTGNNNNNGGNTNGNNQGNSGNNNNGFNNGNSGFNNGSNFAPTDGELFPF